MTASPLLLSRRRRLQRGIALPVMLIVLTIMLLSGVYLLKSSNAVTMNTSNLAYQSVLNKANDLALMSASEWLSSTWTGNRLLLDANVPASGYVANLDTTQTVNSANFWAGKATMVAADGNTIEYVIHRVCKTAGSWNVLPNTCMQTTANSYSLGTSVALGSSLSSTAVQLAGSPQLHYIITARIYGPRGGNVISQMAVLMGP
ncbi:hypothetical protein [Massilia sp. PWRC2]|uniref:hypothetical protein n=1 Tax=Massilia sp. PWRC2 TaxID=2804626 RepID=UPI003CF23A21